MKHIEVLKLEKRLDDNLMYLRDALPEYSTFSFDMKPVHLPQTQDVPINQVGARRVTETFYSVILSLRVYTPLCVCS